MTIPDTSNHIDGNHESWYLEDYKIQFHHNFELDQYQFIDKLASFHFNEIELEDECDTNSQCYDSVPVFESMMTPVSLPDLDPIPKPTLIHIPIELEHEPPILDSHIPLLGNEYELQFYDLDQTHEPTPTLEPKFDLSFIPESVSVPIFSLLSTNHAFYKTTFHCWTKV